MKKLLAGITLVAASAILAIIALTVASDSPPDAQATELADLKLVSASLDGPPTIAVGDSGQVEFPPASGSFWWPLDAAASIHNNGPFGPADAGITFTFATPPGCEALLAGVIPVPPDTTVGPIPLTIIAIAGYQ